MVTNYRIMVLPDSCEGLISRDFPLSYKVDESLNYFAKKKKGVEEFVKRVNLKCAICMVKCSAINLRIQNRIILQITLLRMSHLI